MGIFQISLIAALTLLAANPDDSISKRLEKDRKACVELKKALGADFSVTESYFRRSIISTKTPFGFKIKSVRPGSPAARAGWKKGDILLLWNKRPVKKVSDLLRWVRGAKRGSAVIFEISRRKKKFNLLDRKPWVRIKGKIMPDQPV